MAAGPSTRSSKRKAAMISRGVQVSPRVFFAAPSFTPRSSFIPVKGSERKYFDSSLGGTAFGTGTDWTGKELDPATLLTLFAPAQGTSGATRVGRRVEVHALRIRGLIQVNVDPDETDLPAGKACRLVLLQDMQTNMAQVQAETVMTAPPSASAQLVQTSLQNPQNFGRFRVLKDKTWTFDSPNAGTDGTNTNAIGGQVRVFKWNILFKKPVVIRYNDTDGGTIADVVDNSFHIIGACNQTVNVPVLSYTCRTVYSDA